jgi:hypothetical protein
MLWLGPAPGSVVRRGDLTERARVLKFGGALLAVLIVGLLVGFLVLDRKGGSAPPATSPTLSPTSPTDVRAQVEQAYLRAWDVWADSLLHLDKSRLPDVLTRNALQVITRQVNQQTRKDQPVRIRVEHNYTIALTSATTASIEDRYINHNVRLDPHTLEPIEKDPNHQERTTFTMELVDGTWKIAEIIEYK